MSYPVAAVRGKNFGVQVQTYAEKVLSYSPIAYWPFNETSGTNADNLEGTAAMDGTYARNVTTMGTGTGIGDGNTAPAFDGTQDFVDVYSTGFRDNFPYDEGSFTGWFKVFNAGVWEDGTPRAFGRFATGAGGTVFDVRMNRTVNDGQISYFRDDGYGVEIQESVGSLSATAWTHFALTWSVITGNFKCYHAASQIGSTQEGIAAWDTVKITSNLCTVGANSTTPGQLWHGGLAHIAFFGSALSGTDITALATV